MNANYTILLVDDEEDILQFLGYNLKKEGFTVHTADSGNLAIAIAKETKPHLIILDVMMQGMDGMETCRELRKEDSLKNTLIIFLTARNEDYSQMAGFDAGADDYVAKPVKPGVLVSRVKALLRRIPSRQNEISSRKLIVLDELSIDRERYLVSLGNRDITLPRKEFELLYLLASKPGKVFTRDEIFSAIWGDNVLVGDRTIDVHIRKIREITGLRNIRTVKGVGYKFDRNEK